MGSDARLTEDGDYDESPSEATGSHAPVSRMSESIQRHATASEPATRGQYEQRYGIDIDSLGQVDRLQRLEEANTLETIQRWADDGIPIDAMGTPSKMEAYRQREGTPVPWDIEQRNEASKRRNTSVVQRARRDSPAGKTQVPESVRDVVSSPGKPVDTALRKPVESELGQSLEHARVHRSPAADAACDQLNARAFTVNNHVAVRSDQPDPSTSAGQHLMSHELTHVAQQTGGAISLLPDTGALEVDLDPQLEQEAEETAQRVMQGGELGIQRLSDTDVHVQRMTTNQPTGTQPGPSRYADSWAVADGRNVLQEGFTVGGTRVPKAQKQFVAVCQLGATQAHQQARGRNGRALGKILSNLGSFPYTSMGGIIDIDDVTATPWTTASTVIKALRDDLSVYNGIRTEHDETLFNEAEQEVQEFLKARGVNTWLDTIFSGRTQQQYIKAMAGALTEMIYDSKKSVDPNEQTEHQADIMRVKNILEYYIQNDRVDTGNTVFGVLPSSDNLPWLVQEFFNIVAKPEADGTPFTVVSATFRYGPNGALTEARSAPNVPGPVAAHIVSVQSITTDEQGETWVNVRDSNSPSGKLWPQKLIDFLSMVYDPAIRTDLHRDPLSVDNLWFLNSPFDNDPDDKYTEPIDLAGFPAPNDIYNDQSLSHEDKLRLILAYRAIVEGRLQDERQRANDIGRQQIDSLRRNLSHTDKKYETYKRSKSATDPAAKAAGVADLDSFVKDVDLVAKSSSVQ